MDYVDVVAMVIFNVGAHSRTGRTADADVRQQIFSTGVPGEKKGKKTLAVDLRRDGYAS